VQAAVGASADRLEGISEHYPYRDDPVGWITNVLGHHLWSKQIEIANALVEHQQVAVHSCHGIGKSFLAARLMAQMVSCSEPGEAFVVSTATTFKQVKAVLWKELNRAIRMGNLPGRSNLTEWYQGNELVAFGNKPADNDPAAFQGIHAPRVGVFFDEADGIPDALWDAALGLMTTEDCRWLAVGNPDPMNRYSKFREICRAGSGWHVIHIGWEHTPNCTGEELPGEIKLVDESYLGLVERANPQGKSHPLYKAKVDGIWVDSDDAEWQIIPEAWVRAAQERWREQPTAPGPMTAAGVDPSRGGADEMVIAPLHGTWFAETIGKPGSEVPDGRRAASFVEKNIARGVPIAIDSEGIGTSPTDILAEDGWLVVPIAAGSGAPTVRRRGKDEPIKDASGMYTYANLRAAMWFGFRDVLNPRNGSQIALPPGNEIARQLTAVQYEIRGTRLLVQSKDEIKKVLKRSTDDADAIIQAWYCSKLRRPDAAPIHVQTVSDRRSGKVRW
jgi:hypothetical protein